MLCYYGGTIIPCMNNSITYIDKSTEFLNATKSVPFKDTKQIICGRLELNYNDIEIDIT